MSCKINAVATNNNRDLMTDCYNLKHTAYNVINSNKL